MGQANEVSRRRFLASALATAALAALPAHSMADAEMHQIKGDEMTTLTPYLLFDGNCHQAMEFYKSCFGGELTVHESEGFSGKGSDAAGPAEQNHQCTTQERESGDFGVGLASA